MKVKVKLIGNSYERQSKAGRKYHAGHGIIEDESSRWQTIRVFVVSASPFTGDRTVEATLRTYDAYKGEADVRLP